MKLLCVFAAIFAIAFAEDDDFKKPIIEDSEAVESVESVREGDLKSAASSYNYVPSYQGSQWNQNYAPQDKWNAPPKPIQPTNTYVPPQNTYNPPQNTYNPPQNTYNPPQNTYHPQNTWTGQTTSAPSWTTPQYHQPSTTPVSIIKNEMYYGDNGSYRYEYQIADGTHVGEEGYMLNPNTPEENLVKKGWYSYKGPDGKVYTVQYWADKTGFHPYGDHLPTPPPIPPAIQASLDQIAKEEAEKNKPTPAPVHYPTQAPVHYPTQAPIYYPTQAPIYYPTQAPTYYPTQAPSHYPTQAPSYYPTQAPSHYPTQAPIIYYPQENYPSSGYGKK